MTFYGELRGLDGAARSATGVNGLYFRDDKVLKFTPDEKFRGCSPFGVVFMCLELYLKQRNIQIFIISAGEADN